MPIIQHLIVDQYGVHVSKKEGRLQVMRIGDVAIVGLSGQPFTSLGLQIRRLSPFRYTYVTMISNGAMGYLPDREGYKLKGYQTWAGVTRCAEGTGEAMVAQAVQMLEELYAMKPVQ